MSVVERVLAIANDMDWNTFTTEENDARTLPISVSDARIVVALVDELRDVLPLIDLHESDTRLDTLRAALAVLTREGE